VLHGIVVQRYVCAAFSAANESRVGEKNVCSTSNLRSYSCLYSCFLCTCVNSPWDLSSLLHLDISPHKLVWFHPAVIFASKAMMSYIDQIIKHDAKAMPGTHKCLLWLKPPYFYLTPSVIPRYPWQWDSDAACGKLMGSRLINVHMFGDLDQRTFHFTIILFQRSFCFNSKEPMFWKYHYLDGDEPLGKLLMQGDFIPHYQAGSDHSNFAGLKKMSFLHAEWESVTHQSLWVGDDYKLWTS